MDKKKNRTYVFAALLGFATMVAAMMLPGCSNKLSGEQTANQQPIVWFVNVPPEDNLSSTNPIINWVGQDVDGQIVMYRYVVFTEAEMIAINPSLVAPIDSVQAATFLTSNLNAMPDSVWTYLEVKLLDGDPKTSNIVPMKAEIKDPVNTRVRQYIFVQAYDDLNLASPIVFRAFQRIDNPPDTDIKQFTGGPFINSVFPASSIVGVHMHWLGSDVIDFPTDPPPFEYEWRLYGPYYSRKFVSDTLPDSTWEEVVNNFVKQVVVTSDARVFPMGQNLIDTLLDTVSFVFDSAGDSSIPVLDTQYVLIDTIQASSAYGQLDVLFDVDDTAFANNPRYNRIAAQSSDPTDGDEWITNLGDSIYNVYQNEPSDTTQEQWFIFWVRSRDDAKVPDLTPDFQEFTVIDPKYEHDVGVVDVSVAFEVNGRKLDSARAYWLRAVGNWAASAGITVNYDTSDYVVASGPLGFSFSLRRMLSHKMIVMVNDNPFPGGIASHSFASDLFTAIDAGVNVWLCGRAQVFGKEAGGANFDVFDPTVTPPWLSGIRSAHPVIPAVPFTGCYYYFGLENKVYSGWENHIFFGNQRIEDFIGALSLDQTKWPDLKIDSANLHSRYKWKDHYPWRSDIAALPEVNWFVRSVGSEAMYLYESKYGSKHFLNDPNYNFQGKPVMHRLNRGFFRTVYSQFTPYGMDDATMQTTINSVFNYLFDKNLASPPAAPRYTGARVPTSMAEIRQHFWDRMRTRYEERKARGQTSLRERLR